MHNSDYISWEHRGQIIVSSIERQLKQQSSVQIGNFKVHYNISPSVSPNTQTLGSNSFAISIENNNFKYNIYGKKVEGKVFIDDVERIVAGNEDDFLTFFRDDLDSEAGTALLKEIQKIVESN